MSTRNTTMDGAQADAEGVDPRPWMPVSDGNGDSAGDIDDAEPDADVIVRPDRDVWVALGDRHALGDRAYHLFPECSRQGGNCEHGHAGSINPDYNLCERCELREAVRVAVSDDEVPPNPTVAPDTEAYNAKAKAKMPDGIGPDNAGDWLNTGRGSGAANGGERQ